LNMQIPNSSLCLLKDFYGHQPRGLKAAMGELDLKFSGREHSGIDDAVNTATLAQKMIESGALLLLTKTTNTTHFNKEIPSNFTKIRAQIEQEAGPSSFSSIPFSNKPSHSHTYKRSSKECRLLSIQPKSLLPSPLHNSAFLKDVNNTFDEKERVRTDEKERVRTDKHLPTGTGKENVPTDISPVVSSSLCQRQHGLTPPMCNCGRRAKMSWTNKAGANQVCMYKQGFCEPTCVTWSAQCGSDSLRTYFVKG
jgi:hypothetical protein